MVVTRREKIKRRRISLANQSDFVTGLAQLEQKLSKEIFADSFFMVFGLRYFLLFSPGVKAEKSGSLVENPCFLHPDHSVRVFGVGKK